MEILWNLVAALAPILTLMLGWLSKKLVDLINAKVQNTYLQGVLTRVDYAVMNAVKNLQQTVVDELKRVSEDGKITKEEADQIKQAAVAQIKTYLGSKGIAEIMAVLGLTLPGFHQMLEQRVEAAVFDLKITHPMSYRR